MARLKNKYAGNGFFGVGILNNANDFNVGTLWRSAYVLGASFLFTVIRKYEPQGSDVTHAWTKVPLYHYGSVGDLKAHLPHSTQLIGVEMAAGALPLARFEHPLRAVYLLGNEKRGLDEHHLEHCAKVVQLPGTFSLNVAVAGSIVMYDRVSKMETAPRS
ncbi:MAG: RNA methyltransferase [Deferrisomatales bacterium]|nr:RNA methyltransferase [Deferrisomatales bacterium]